jgi:hypothetical protein
MLSEKLCPFCGAPAITGCAHLALATEARAFVSRCVDLCHGAKPWQTIRALSDRRRRFQADWAAENDDFTWLETAFCERFLKRLRWFGGMDHEWRTGPKEGQGGFWVLLWSKDPQRLWWELRDEFEFQSLEESHLPNSARPVGPGFSSMG